MNKINKNELHEIFENLRKKDQNAYNKLYENYYNLIYGIVFSILKNKDDSEDITHEIFTKIYKLDVNKLPTNNESSWIFTVSKNECFLYLRKVKPNISIEEIYEIPELSNDIDKVIDIEYYNKLLKNLKEEEKLIVSLKVLSNFTFSKISQVMNIPIGTVQWKYYNAINSLKVSISSLVGAVIAFIIVLARGEFLNNKQFLNEKENTKIENTNNDKQNNQVQEHDKTELDDSIINSENKENDNIIDSEKQENKFEINNATSENNENQDIVENTHEIENIEKPDIQNQDNKNEILQNETSQEAPQETSCIAVVSKFFENQKIDSVQTIFTTLGIVLIIIFITFFKIYQQKLRKKSSK